MNMKPMGMAGLGQPAPRSAPPCSTSGRHAAPLEQHALRASAPGAAALAAGPQRRARPRSQPCTAVAFDERQATVPGRPFTISELRDARLRQRQQQGPGPGQGLPPSPDGQFEQWGGGTAAGFASFEDISDVELMRRSKISAANKGRSPWNLGRQHSEETKAKIRERTFAAMQRPEVRERLKQANEHRVPHSDSTKEKIRVSLQARAAKTRAIIATQADLIVAKMAASPDAATAEAAAHPKAAAVVAGLAWQHFKRDWETLAEVGWEASPEFRERVVHKIANIGTRRAAKNDQRKKKGDRVRAALQQMKRLSLAEAKMAEVEAALAKLQKAKAALAGADPSRAAVLAAAEGDAVTLLAKLREQVGRLKEALEPLEEYLVPPAAAGPGAAGHEMSDASEQRAWEARQAARARAAGGPANGAVPVGRGDKQPLAGGSAAAQRPPEIEAAFQKRNSMGMPWSVESPVR